MVPEATQPPFTSYFIISCPENKGTNSNNSNNSNNKKKSPPENNPDLKYHAMYFPADAEMRAVSLPVHSSLC